MKKAYGEKTFATELFGFSKKDVSAYIQSLSRNAKEHDVELAERCARLEDEVSKLNAELEKKTALLSQTEKKLLESEERGASLKSGIEKISKEISALLDSAL